MDVHLLMECMKRIEAIERDHLLRRAGVRASSEATSNGGGLGEMGKMLLKKGIADAERMMSKHQR